jgi:hypothetical protein
MSVKAWQEEVNIPTYEIGKAEKNPIFLEKECTREVVALFILIL